MGEDGSVPLVEPTSAPSLQPWLREILRCPVCRGVLRDGAAPDNPDGPDDVARSELHCAVCRLAYRVDDAVPVLLADQARPLQAQE